MIDRADLEKCVSQCVQSFLNSSDFVGMVVNAIMETITQKVVEELKETIDFSNSKVDNLERTLDKHRQEVADLERALASRTDDLEQYQRRCNLRIFGIAEKKGESTDALALDIITQKLGLKDFDLLKIDRSHRVGRPKAGVIRPIIVKFTAYRDRAAVFTRKKALKGSKITIREDLTSSRLQLLKEAINKFELKNVWTVDGLIVVRVADKFLQLASMASYRLHPEVEQLLVCRLNDSVRLKLSELLDDIKVSCTEDHISRDYRGLAQLVNLSSLDAMLLRKEQQPTEKVLSLWCKMEPTCTVGKLVEHLEKMRCYYVIDEVMPMLEKRFNTNVSSTTNSSASVQILPRDWWNLRESKLEKSLPQTVGLAFLMHTNRTEDINDQLEDVMRRRQQQNIQFVGGSDFDCNYVVSPDGRIVEGTGWCMGDTPARYNHMAVSVTLLGNYDIQEPDSRMLDATKNLLHELVHQNKLEQDFGLYGVCNVLPVSSPGKWVMEAVKSWPSFHKKGKLQDDWPASATSRW